MKRVLPLFLLGWSVMGGINTLSAQNINAANITSLGANAKAAAVTVKLTGTLTSTSNGDFRQLRDLCYQMSSLDISTANCTAIPKNALHSRHNLRKLLLPTQVKTIGSQAFFACDALEGTLTIPNSATSIGASAFAECKKLEGLTINSSSFLTNIGSYAFEGCESLGGNVLIPRYVRILRDGVFSGCKNLESVTFPDNLQSIGANTFSGCESLSGDINFGKMIVKIGASAFMGCKSLKGISLPRALQQLGDAAFMDCTGLSGTISLPSSLTSLGKGAFAGCSGVEKIILPEELTNIPAASFAGMTGLLSVTNYAAEPTTIDASAFAGVDCSKVNLYVPQGSEDKYKEAAVWKEFNIDTITSVDNTKALASVSLSVEGSNLWVKDLPKGSKVVLYNAQGKELSSQYAEGTIRFTLNEPGVYVVTINGQSHKVNY